MRMLSRRNIAFGLLLVIPALFASNNVAARMADGVVGPAALAFWRWFLASVLILPIAIEGLRRKKTLLRREWPHILVLALIGMTLVSLVTFVGARRTSASNIGLIYAATPAIILLLDRLLTGVALTARQLVGLAVCLFGIGFIVLRGQLSALLELRFSTGDLLICAGAIAWALYSVLLKYWPSGLNVVERASVIAMAGAMFCFPLALLEADGFPASLPSPKAIGIVLTIGVLAGGLLIVLHAFVTDVLGPRVALVLLYLTPLYNILLAWLVLDEALELYQAVGGTLVLAGIAFGMRRSAPGPARRGSAR
jgi:drug/metabolite transporter (DMT)-like permease